MTAPKPIGPLKRKAEIEPSYSHANTDHQIVFGASSAAIKPPKRQKKTGDEVLKMTTPKKPKAPAKSCKKAALVDTVTETSAAHHVVADGTVIAFPAAAGDHGFMANDREFAFLDLIPSVEAPGSDDTDAGADFERTDVQYSSNGHTTPSSARKRKEKGKTPIASIPSKPPPEGKLSIRYSTFFKLIKAALNQEMPPKVADWNEDRLAPTEPFATPQPCPFDWDYIQTRTKGLNDTHIQAYVRRAPWNPEEYQKSFSAVLKEVNVAGDMTVSVEEAIRKRFRVANIRVFQATGVYFENNVLGVDKEYSLLARKNRPKLNKTPNADQNPRMRIDEYTILTNEENKHPSAQTYAFILQPPTPLYTDRCIKCCEEGACYDQGCVEDDCCDQCCFDEWLCKKCSSDGGRRDSCLNPDCGQIACKCPCKHHPTVTREAHSPYKYQKSLKKKGAPFGCPNTAHEPLKLRYVGTRLLEKVSHRKFEEVTLLRVEPKAFDLFTSCIVLGLGNGVPEQLLRLSQRDPERPNEAAVYEAAGDDYTLGDILKAYCCAQVLQCPAVSDTLLNDLLVTVKAEQALAEPRRSSKPCEKISVSRFSTLEFEPEDLNYVYQNTSPDDPIRLLLLDIISDKAQYGRSKIQEREAEYDPEFLQYWMTREFNELAQLIRARDIHIHRRDFDVSGRKNTMAWDRKIADRNQRIDAIQKNHSIDTFPQAIAQQQQRAANEPNQSGLVGILDMIHESPEEAAFSGDMIEAEAQYIQYKDSFESIIWGNWLFRGWEHNPPRHYNGTKGSEEFIERLSHPNSFLKDVSVYEAAFCDTYHNDCTEDLLCLHKPVALSTQAPTSTRRDNLQRRNPVRSSTNVREESMESVHQSVERETTPFGSHLSTGCREDTMEHVARDVRPLKSRRELYIASEDPKERVEREHCERESAMFNKMSASDRANTAQQTSRDTPVGIAHRELLLTG